MRPLGFSTGALAKGNFQAGLEIQRRLGVTAIELSALRGDELLPLMDALPKLDLQGFSHISLHAPSKLGGLDELDLVAILNDVPTSWPIIVHPDLIQSPSHWRFFGPRLCLENMDQRKPVGRTVPEMEGVFQQLPAASFCFDIGHARQVDPTMGIAIGMLRRFKGRLRQVHMSEVDPHGKHIPISFAALCAFQRVARLIPEDCPVILESVVDPGRAQSEIEVAIHALTESPDLGDISAGSFREASK
ncbi:MAG TPA: hypothetical protein VFR03_20675 [Thermoanaerobaculia bacterium]|nr:hypothetical protein [Thermoanaerobaculia bacterium]